MQSHAVSEIRGRGVKITQKPIIYYWWFNTGCFDKLLGALEAEVDDRRILRKYIGPEEYGLLYVGKGVKGNDRLVEYHIKDQANFHAKGVLNGRLSSLRQTLCGLLDVPMSKGKSVINSFIDSNCIVEFEICSADDLNDLEIRRIRSNYLPLNYHHTSDILTKKHRKILAEIKKKVRL